MANGYNMITTALLKTAKQIVNYFGLAFSGFSSFFGLLAKAPVPLIPQILLFMAGLCHLVSLGAGLVKTWLADKIYQEKLNVNAVPLERKQFKYAYLKEDLWRIGVGTFAAIFALLGTINPLFFIPSAWILASSNIFSSRYARKYQEHFQKKPFGDTPLKRDYFKERVLENDYNVKFADFLLLSSINLAAAGTIAVIFPPAAPFLAFYGAGSAVVFIVFAAVSVILSKYHGMRASQYAWEITNLNTAQSSVDNKSDLTPKAEPTAQNTKDSSLNFVTISLSLISAEEVQNAYNEMKTNSRKSNSALPTYTENTPPLFSPKIVEPSMTNPLPSESILNQFF